MNFYIFRHGETHATKTGTMYGPTVVNAPTIREGIPAMKRQAEYLKNVKTDYNVRSEFYRVRQTAEIITDITGKKFIADSRLNDIIFKSPNMGDLNKLAETTDEFISRMNGFVNDIKSCNYESVLIGTHGWPIAAIKYLVTNGKITHDELMDFPVPSVLTIIKDNKIEEIDFN